MVGYTVQKKVQREGGTILVWNLFECLCKQHDCQIWNAIFIIKIYSYTGTPLALQFGSNKSVHMYYISILQIFFLVIRS